jgi:hypothetical protein
LSIRDPVLKLTASTDIQEWMAQKRPRSLGWPFDLLRPNETSAGIGWREGTVASLLLAWWVYAIAANPWPSEGRQFLLDLGLVGFPVAMAIIRLGRYCTNYSSPINVWGRLFTFRWIIPGYDKVFVAPLLAVALAIVTGGMIHKFYIDPLAVVPVAVACTTMIALNLGPSLQDWRHTGNHRISPKYNARVHLRL